MKGKLLLLLLLLTGCGLFKKTTKSKATTQTEIPFITKLDSELAHLPAIQGKANGSLSINKQKQSATLTFSFQPHHFLLVKASLFSIEGVRGFVSPDSTYFLNRLEKTAIVGNTQKFLDSLGVPVSFAELQGLLFGIPPSAWLSRLQQQKDLLFTGMPFPNIQLELRLDPQTFHIAHLKITSNDQLFTATFQKYQPYQNTFVPQQVEIQFQGKRTGSVIIDDIHVKPLPPDFSPPKIQIPDQYHVEHF